MTPSILIAVSIVSPIIGVALSHILPAHSRIIGIIGAFGALVPWIFLPLFI